MDDGAQATVSARVPGAGALGLVAPPSGVTVPGAQLADPAWTASVLDDRARRQRTGDRRVLGTLWWYSLSSVLLTPTLAGLLTGRPLSPRLADTQVHLIAGHVPVAATTAAAAGDVLAGLRDTLEQVTAVVAEAGRVRERPLQAVSTDSLANRLLALGRALGDVPGATALAGPLATALGLPAPRYADVDRRRFTRRASCCLAYRVPGDVLCTSCPRRPPVERRVLLEDTAARLPPDLPG
ncbi:iron reductase [Modestobacter sp. I12A-02628]|uniref:Iron reductase n=1 Tax=Goekera deserti TaxID=2497753 RepID=A0A7K3WEJ6_9ACTN|nr:(2Fe-2S)-binding protein [Goekera deserti]MPQ98059.1 iron reductase [Goekera deserti]NDI48706.1 iron reductase [Goekera deserti]NEL54915.1 iron reductase [Goekera deserti]